MDPKQDPRIVTLLIIAIVALAGVIVWLALYIRSVHNKNGKQQVENTRQILTMTEKVVEVITRVDSTMLLHTKSNELTTQQTVMAMTALDRTVNDLHKYILQSTK